MKHNLNVYSNIGKNLVAKCHMLRQENIALCKQINSDRISKLEDELMLQKDFVQEFKKSQLGITLVNIIFIHKKKIKKY